MKKALILLSVLLLALSFVACSDDDDVTPLPFNAVAADYVVLVSDSANSSLVDWTTATNNSISDGSGNVDTWGTGATVDFNAKVDGYSAWGISGGSWGNPMAIMGDFTNTNGASALLDDFPIDFDDFESVVFWIKPVDCTGLKVLLEWDGGAKDEVYITNLITNGVWCKIELNLTNTFTGVMHQTYDGASAQPTNSQFCIFNIGAGTFHVTDWYFKAW